MAKYVINEAKGGSFRNFPNMNLHVEADKYEERGSFTVFTDAEGKEVFSVKTSEITHIRTEE